MSRPLHRLCTATRRGFAGIVLAVLVSACGGGGSDSDEQEKDIVYFGPITKEDVTFTLTGTITYEDRLLGVTEPGAYGFTTTKYKPVRHAVVDLVDESNQVLLTTRTNELGRYTLAGTASGLLHLRVLARTDPQTGIQVEVRNSGGDLYAASRYFVPAPGDLDLDAKGGFPIPIAAMAGAFNILDLFTAGAEFVQHHDLAYPSKLTGYWQPGSDDGTYFTDEDDSIHVLGGTDLGTGDTDEFDDDVLLHEYGHFIERYKGKLDSLGGSHSIPDNTQDLRLAWSEGWASFISGSIKDWLRTTPAMAGILSDTTGVNSLYLDTLGTEALLWWIFDFDPAAEFIGAAERNSYASSETAVAKVLWNISSDQGFDGVWAAYHKFPASPRPRPVSLETYWDTWLTHETVQQSFLERVVNYTVDVPDSSFGAPTSLEIGCTGSGEHTLSNDTGSDVDYFSITTSSAQSKYVIETFVLNGADTQISVVNASDSELSTCGDAGTAVCFNNNASDLPYTGLTTTLNINNGDPQRSSSLASRLTFIAPYAGTFYVRVSPADTPSLAAGRYGTYRVRTTLAGTSCPL